MDAPPCSRALTIGFFGPGCVDIRIALKRKLLTIQPQIRRVKPVCTLVIQITQVVNPVMALESLTGRLKALVELAELSGLITGLLCHLCQKNFTWLGSYMTL